MKMNNIHLVPQVIIDCAQNIFRDNKINETYAIRIEAIRDYCNSELQKYENVKNKSLFDDLHKRKASTGRYSRIGRNNV